MNKWKFYNSRFEFLEDCMDHIWYGHIFFAYDLVRNLKPSIFVELGTYYGSSLSAFSQAVKDAKIQTHIFAIDSWEGDANTGYYGSYVYEHTRGLVKKYYPDLNINLVKKYFDKALDDFADKSIDIIHIDGLHTYEAVKKDFTDWLPKMRENGVMLFHDIFVPEYGVKDLWAELKSNPNYKFLEFPHSYGLGVLFLNGNDFDELFNDLDCEELVNHYVQLALKSISVEDIIRAETSRNIIRAELEKTIDVFNKIKLDLEEANRDREALHNKINELERINQDLCDVKLRLNNIESRKVFKIVNKLMTAIGRPL